VPGVFPGGKGGWCVRLTASPPSCAVDMKSGNLNFLEPSGPLQACNRISLPYRYEFPDIHNTHAHVQLYVHASLLLRVRTMFAAGRLFAAAPKSRHTLILPCSCHFTRNSVSVFIRLRCLNDKISWLGGWASQWRPPQLHCLLHGAIRLLL